jgi:hypothetical protein
MVQVCRLTRPIPDWESTVVGEHGNEDDSSWHTFPTRRQFNRTRFGKGYPLLDLEDDSGTFKPHAPTADAGWSYILAFLLLESTQRHT